MVSDKISSLAILNKNNKFWKKYQLSASASEIFKQQGNVSLEQKFEDWLNSELIQLKDNHNLIHYSKRYYDDITPAKLTNFQTQFSQLLDINDSYLYESQYSQLIRNQNDEYLIKYSGIFSNYNNIQFLSIGLLSFLQGMILIKNNQINSGDIVLSLEKSELPYSGSRVETGIHKKVEFISEADQTFYYSHSNKQNTSESSSYSTGACILSSPFTAKILEIKTNNSQFNSYDVTLYIQNNLLKIATTSTINAIGTSYYRFLTFSIPFLNGENFYYKKLSSLD